MPNTMTRIDVAQLERASGDLHTALVAAAAAVAADGGEDARLLAVVGHLTAAMDATNAALRTLDA